jgi:fructose-bisphosphate aldolase class I
MGAEILCPVIPLPHRPHPWALKPNTSRYLIIITMNIEALKITARALMGGDKGLLAMDESLHTINERFEKVGIPLTEEYRRAYRELIVTTPNFGEAISGAILFDETIRQSTKDGIPFVEILNEQGIIPGIKLDLGTVPLSGFPGEKITEGIDGLAIRIKEYAKLGARFAKWRAVITIGKDLPSIACIDMNMSLLARYAAICQEAGIVPIVEPEVLMDGDHLIGDCYNATFRTIKVLFYQLQINKVALEGLILKPNMVLPGKDSKHKAGSDQVADATCRCLLEAVPPNVAGIAFLSGGQTPKEATENLNAMHVRFKNVLPWPLTFSYSRAIQQPALEVWQGKPEMVKGAQRLLYFRAKLNQAAREGKYFAGMEVEAA